MALSKRISERATRRLVTRDLRGPFSRRTTRYDPKKRHESWKARWQRK